MLFQTEFTDVVTWLIIAIILYIAFRNLSHITQHMSCIRISIFSDASFLHIEARKTEHLFLEHAKILIAQLSHEELLRISGISRILTSILDIFHTLDEKFLGNT